MPALNARMRVSAPEPPVCSVKEIYLQRSQVAWKDTPYHSECSCEGWENHLPQQLLRESKNHMYNRVFEGVSGWRNLHLAIIIRGS